jgi:hypothetical protein
MAARIAVVAVAVVVLAWLGVMERDTRLQSRAVQATQSTRDRATLARADADLRAARFLNPDTAPDFNRALLLRIRGDTSGAAAVLRDVVRREPDNVTAWRVLYALTRDPRALAEARRLDPLPSRG